MVGTKKTFSLALQKIFSLLQSLSLVDSKAGKEYVRIGPVPKVHRHFPNGQEGYPQTLSLLPRKYFSGLQRGRSETFSS